MMAFFYAENIENGTVFFDQSESMHCVRALRLDKGARVGVCDGKGRIAEAIIEVPDPKRARLHVVGDVRLLPARPYSLHVAMAPTKKIDRFEFFVEKAIELGVDRITPLLCENSERRKLNTERLQKLAISALKQSRCGYLPTIDELTPCNLFAEQHAGTLAKKLIAHCSGQQRKDLNEALSPGGEYVAMVGPEGDFTAEEVKGAKKSGFVEISLGRERLRTETSGIMICASLKMLNL